MSRNVGCRNGSRQVEPVPYVPCKCAENRPLAICPTIVPYVPHGPFLYFSMIYRGHQRGTWGACAGTPEIDWHQDAYCQSSSRANSTACDNQSAAGSDQACSPWRRSNNRRSSGSGGNSTPRRKLFFHALQDQLLRSSRIITGDDRYLRSATRLRAAAQNPRLRSSPVVSAMSGIFHAHWAGTRCAK